MANLHYTFPTARIGLWTRIRNRFAGRADRKSVYKQFLIDNNIDSKEEISARTVTNARYIIRTHHVEYLAHIRDRQIMKDSKKAFKIRDKLREQQKDYLAEIAKEEDALVEYEKSQKETKHRLEEKSNSALTKVHLMGAQGTLEASVKNQKQRIETVQANLTQVESELQNIRKEFGEGADLVRAEYDNVLNEYVKLAGRRLNRAGFTFYDSEMRDCSDEVKTLIKELADGK